MTTTSVLIVAIVCGIIGAGLFVSWFSRYSPRQTMMILALTLGMALLSYGHLQWLARRESPEVKQALYTRQIVAGWALLGIGLLGWWWNPAARRRHS